MKKSFGNYQRLAQGALGCSSVWLGPDHLLYVRGNGFLFPFSEEYRRFRYRDIRAVVLARTTGIWVGILLYGLSLLSFAALSFFLLYLREPGDTFPMILTLVFPLPLSVLSLSLLVRHLVLGPRCVFEIQTGISCERLRPITRVQQGRTALEPLSERIRDAQAGPPGAGTGSTTAAETAPPTGFGVPAPALPAFLIFASAAALLLAGLHANSTAIAGAFLLLGIAGAAPLLISLATGVRRGAPDSVLIALWSLMVVALLAYGGGLVYFFAMALDDPGLTLGLGGPLEAFARIRELGGPAFYGIFLGLGAVALMLSLMGTLLCLKRRGDSDRSDA